MLREHFMHDKGQKWNGPNKKRLRKGGKNTQNSTIKRS